MMNAPADWVDAYIDSHPDTCIADAEQAWWDEQVEKGDPEVGALSPEAEKVSKAMRKGNAVNAYGKTVKRERKANLDKAWAMQRIGILWDGFAGIGEVSDVTVDNPERAISYTRNGKRYTLTLTEHRTPKG